MYPPDGLTNFAVNVPASLSNTTELELSWTPPAPVEGMYEEATGYHLYVNSTYQSDLGAVSSYTLTMLSSNTLYSIYLIPFNADGDGPQSTTINKYTRPTAPSFSSITINTTSITLNVTYPMGVNNANFYLGGSLVSSSMSGSFDYTSLTPNTSYSLEARSLNADNDESESYVYNAVTTPEPPTSITTQDRTAFAVTINFTSTYGATSYTVFNTSGDTQLGFLSGSGQSLSVTGEEFTCYIIAYNSQGDPSAHSDNFVIPAYSDSILKKKYYYDNLLF